jgi:hypothetical protein
MERKKWDRWTPERIQRLRELLVSGKTLEECASIMAVKNRQAICKIRMKYLPDLARSEYGHGAKLKKKAENKVEENRRKYNRTSRIAKNLSDLEKAQSLAFIRKKNAARQRGIEFSIGPDDLEWPTHCPVLGVELDWLAGGHSPNSPSFDRIDSTKGYIPGNVAIISWRANRIKNDGTAEEHRKIFEWLAQKEKVVVQ